MERFEAKLEPVAHGGHFVAVPTKVALAAPLAHGARVRGTVNGAPFRSSLMKHGGVFRMGVHKATLAAAGAKPGERVEVAIELDDQPLPTDEVPEDFAAAIAKSKPVAAAWDRLARSHRREHVQAILEAKKPETRARRIATAIGLLRAMPAPKKSSQRKTR